MSALSYYHLKAPHQYNAKYLNSQQPHNNMHFLVRKRNTFYVTETLTYFLLASVSVSKAAILQMPFNQGMKTWRLTCYYQSVAEKHNLGTDIFVTLICQYFNNISINQSERSMTLFQVLISCYFRITRSDELRHGIGLLCCG